MAGKQKSDKVNITKEHKDVAEHTRKITTHLLELIGQHINDEEKFYKVLQQSDRASLTLQRLSSTLGHLVPLERTFVDQKKTLKQKRKDISKEDCEVIISLVKQWGLLKEGSEREIDRIVEQYMMNDKKLEDQDGQ
ncbi:MAG: hypothetical protein ACK5WS_01970 [Alphaproteobacteria bacterium]|jgi:hypothetical protein|nr:hypothetical protein [Candidatus Jidaibacter sp.]